ncbi:GNAT family N-acetyltransferase [Deinococcus hohokamensis]|uniref:GNAT family N-acetyltransferase n=1 Tax=Deinococcus hohokamensis TaxID=309883 RepID=A0ABV9IEF2_9DEIO
MIEFITEQVAWQQALNEVGGYDFYHTHDYHQLEQKPGETATLLRFREEGTLILLPLLLRPLPSALGRPDLHDATSVYGYAGPLAQGDTAAVEAAFQQMLETALRERGVVTVFSRLHPLLDHSAVLTGLGEVFTTGVTVSLDLTEPPEAQRAAYRRDTKYNLNKLRRGGVECRELPWAEYGDVFVSIYDETMRRVEAQSSYFFPRAYYDRLFEMEGVETRLFGCIQNGEVVCAGLFTFCQGIVQYHLSGTRDAALSMGPSRLMLDTVRLWGMERGAQVLHLGGGVGGQRDSLFEFKAGFSKREHAFKLWRWVVDPRIYADLCLASLCPPESSFFPAYRAPAPVTMESTGA